MVVVVMVVVVVLWVSDYKAELQRRAEADGRVVSKGLGRASGKGLKEGASHGPMDCSSKPPATGGRIRYRWRAPPFLTPRVLTRLLVGKPRPRGK